MNNPDHYEFEVCLNLHKGTGELNVLFSGFGRPHEKHGIGPAVHDYYLLHSVTAGKGSFATNGRTYECKAGDSFLIVPGRSFRYEADAAEPWTYLWVGFRGAAVQELLGRTGFSSEHPVLNGLNRQMTTLYHRMRKTLREDPASIADMSGAGYLQLLLAEIGRMNRAGMPETIQEKSMLDKQIEYAIHYIRTQFAQRISIEALTSSLGYHRTYFSQAFKERVGLSPQQYLHRTRMKQAERLLRESDYAVEEVAGSVGYADPLYFSKQFHQWSGLAPTAYRKNNHSE